MHLIQHVFALVAAAWLVWLPGWWLVSRFDLRGPESSVPPLSTQFLAGLSTWVAALFALAASGLFTASAFLAVAAACHVLAAIEARRVQAASRDFRWGSLKDGLRAIALPGTASLVVLIPVFGLTLTPSVSWDASVYHLTLPKLYLEHGGFFPVEMNVYSHWPQGLELLFGAAMALHGFVLAKALHFGCGLLVITTLVRLCPGRSGWLAAALFVLNDVVLFEMRVAYIDLAYAFALLVGTAYAAESTPVDDDALRRRNFLVGVAAGLLISLKVTGLVSAAILALTLLPSGWREWAKSGPTGAMCSAAAFAAPCAVLGAPWWIKTWIFTGNPVYPWFWNLFGGPDWSLALHEQFATWQRSIGMGREWDDYLLLPWRVIVEGGQGYGRFDGEISLLWLAGVPLAIIAAGRSMAHHRRWRLFGFVALLHAIFWASSSQQMRFLIPVLALIAAPAASVVGVAAARFIDGSDARRTLLTLTSTVLFLAVATTQHGKVIGSGLQVVPVMLHPTISPQPNVPEIFQAVAQLPEDARLLFLNTNQGFFSARPFIADSFFEASQINDWLRTTTSPSEVFERLHQRSITHILYRHSGGGGLPYPQPLFDLLNHPRQAERIGFDGHYLLIALRDPRSTQPASSTDISP
ncbi:MAG: hypothetical protein AAGF23_03235 [Acidobacteriota bacterium]